LEGHPAWWLPNSRPSPLDGVRVVQAQEIEKRADLVVALGGMPHVGTAIERVVVPSPLALAGHVAGLDEIRDDALRCPLRDSYGYCDVPQSCAGVVLQTEQDLRVTSDEAPRCGFRT